MTEGLGHHSLPWKNTIPEAHTALRFFLWKYVGMHWVILKGSIFPAYKNNHCILSSAPCPDKCSGTELLFQSYYWCTCYIYCKPKTHQHVFSSSLLPAEINHKHPHRSKLDLSATEIWTQAFQCKKRMSTVNQTTAAVTNTKTRF